MLLPLERARLDAIQNRHGINDNINDGAFRGTGACMVRGRREVESALRGGEWGRGGRGTQGEHEPQSDYSEWSIRCCTQRDVAWSPA